MRIIIYLSSLSVLGRTTEIGSSYISFNDWKEPPKTINPKMLVRITNTYRWKDEAPIADPGSTNGPTPCKLWQIPTAPLGLSS